MPAFRAGAYNLQSISALRERVWFTRLDLINHHLKLSNYFVVFNTLAITAPYYILAGIMVRFIPNNNVDTRPVK